MWSKGIQPVQLSRRIESKRGARMEMIRHRNFNNASYNESVGAEVVSCDLNTYVSEFETLLAKIEHLKQEQSL